MAIISLKNVEVTRVNRVGHGVQVTESNETNGRTYKTRYTVWFTAEHGLREGDIINVSGLHNAKVGEPYPDKVTGELRHPIEQSVNSPRIDNKIAQAPARAGFENDLLRPYTNDNTPF
jgi:hypothetical protein